MYAAQKYSAQDRVNTSQEFSRKYPNRVPTVLSSPHWPFYSFKCLLVPIDITVRELCEVVFTNWKSKFPEGTTHVLLRVASGSPGATEAAKEGPLTPTRTCDDLSRHHLAPDGLLYLTAHTLH